MSSFRLSHRQFLEYLLVLLASHSACLAACFGAGVAVGSCHTEVQSGHPLTYMAQQITLLAFGVFVAYAVVRARKNHYKTGCLFLLTALVFYPPLRAFASTALQSIVLIHSSLWLLNKIGVFPVKGTLCKETEKNCSCSNFP